MSLELPVAVFLLVLIGVTYAMVKLHDQNIKPFVVGWKIIRKLLKPVRRNVKTSLVEVFASFIYLSCSRLLLASLYILMPCTMYTYNPQSDVLTKRYFVTNSPTVEYFGSQHLPFALLAIVLSTMFFTLPMFLLFLYPSSLFQNILNKLGCITTLFCIHLWMFFKVYTRMASMEKGTIGTFLVLFSFLLC